MSVDAQLMGACMGVRHAEATFFHCHPLETSIVVSTHKCCTSRHTDGVGAQLVQTLGQGAGNQRRNHRKNM